jgi:hypothetical protein
MRCCPDCDCHVKSQETPCPHCGTPLARRERGARSTTAALVLGLTAAALPAVTPSCASETTAEDDDSTGTVEAVTAYGVGPVGGFGGTPSQGGGANGGEGGAGAQGGEGGAGGSP